MRLLLSILALGVAVPATAQELEVHFIEVGQGDATLVLGPTGGAFLFDGGPNGEGANTLVPYLQGKGIGSLEFIATSHYHADHIGGLEEIWNAGIHTAVVYDRGDSNPPGTQTFADYQTTFAGVRQTVTPGQVVPLGGGATATCLVVEGALAGGGSVDISGSAQYENSASIAWKIEYGDFDLFVGGDLTGGGSGATNVEGAVGPICGDLDVLRVNHHGSSTSSEPAFILAVAPEAAIISCGAGNQYGFPRQDTVDNLNRWDRVIPVWCTTEGTGGTGFVDAGGTIELRSDGLSWSMSGADGLQLKAHCDENAPHLPTPGEIAISEFQRNPVVVPDDQGEWAEIGGARLGQAVSLIGLELGDAGTDLIRFGTSLQLEAGEVAVIAASGIPAANGGIRPAMAWPVGSMQLANASDRLELRLTASSTVLDLVGWDISWPGGTGKSAEREDMLASAGVTNFVAGSAAYGLGDLGSPGRVNDGDTTNWGSTTHIVVNVAPTVGGILDMDWVMPGEAGRNYQGWITLGTTPGFQIGGTHIPANLDTLFQRTRNLSGWSGVVPTQETVNVRLPVPNSALLNGLTVHAIVVTFDPPKQVRTIATPVAMIVM